jgi:DNA-binding MarR family transcriptional regulator
MSNQISEEQSRALTAANRRYQQATDALDQAASELMGINRTDARCIDIVLLRGRLTAGELAREAGLSPGAVTTALDRLERAGFARRVSDPEDRRRVLVEPTERIAELAELVYGPLRDSGVVLMQRFSERQLKMITAFFEGAADIQLERALQVREQVEREAKPSPRRGPARGLAHDA